MICESIYPFFLITMVKVGNENESMHLNIINGHNHFEHSNYYYKGPNVLYSYNDEVKN
jgi:hypothetical protein